MFGELLCGGGAGVEWFVCFVGLCGVVWGLRGGVLGALGASWGALGSNQGATKTHHKTNIYQNTLVFIFVLYSPGKQEKRNENTTLNKKTTNIEKAFRFVFDLERAGTQTKQKGERIETHCFSHVFVRALGWASSQKSGSTAQSVVPGRNIWKSQQLLRRKKGQER